MKSNTRRSQEHYWRSKENRIKHNQGMSRLREARCAKGMCYRCGKPREDQNLKTCKSCRDRQAELQKNYRIYKLLNYLCIRCGDPVEDKKFALCEDCREKTRTQQRRYRSANSRGSINSQPD